MQANNRQQTTIVFYLQLGMFNYVHSHKLFIADNSTMKNSSKHSITESKGTLSVITSSYYGTSKSFKFHRSADCKVQTISYLNLKYAYFLTTQLGTFKLDSKVLAF